MLKVTAVVMSLEEIFMNKIEMKCMIKQEY